MPETGRHGACEMNAASTIIKSNDQKPKNKHCEKQEHTNNPWHEQLPLQMHRQI
jgi:hypothetical protein